MKDNPLTLGQLHPRKIYIPFLLAAAATLLVLGLFLPVITLKEMVFWKSTFSVITGIQSLFEEKHYILAGIIFLFSIIFPIFKLIALSLIWFSHLTDQTSKRFLYWLGILGKWSMLDVFVVAITIVITKISGFAEGQARIGIYLFATSIILTMLLAERIERLVKK